MSALPTPISAATQASAANAWLADLNPQQRCAVEHGIDPATGTGPLLVIAGAGSGKTATIAHRVARLVAAGADPQRILLLTFSRRAAVEMERRAARILSRVAAAPGGGQVPTLPWAGTFHGIGARILRRYAERIGLHPSFTIHDRGDAEDLLAMTRHELDFSVTKKRFPAKATALAIYSRTVNSQEPLRDVLASAFPWCAHWEAELKQLFSGYVAAKQAQNVLDYDDLLLYWSGLMTDDGLAEEVGACFDHVLVDEYQDTNRLQAAILLAMKPDGRGLTVVGDDAQSIYSFRAATVRNILDFPSQFAQPARVLTLDRNYRSTQPILAASNAVIGLARERYAKDLWTDRVSAVKPQLVTVRDEMDQARCVAECILEQREMGIALKAQAVLFRSSSHSAALELELTRRDIPFVKFGGLKFLEAAHVKDVLAVLRWAENPRDRITGFRVVRLLSGVGPATAAKLIGAMDEAQNPMAAIEAFVPPAAAAHDWSGMVTLMQTLRSEQAGWPSDMELVTRWYEPHLERVHDDAHVRRGDLAQLMQIASTYRSRERFLTELTLDPPAATSDEAGVPGLDDDYLVLSTIHSAKGQEWKSVHILNVVDGCIPSDMATGSAAEIDEERRLLYVGMTRARDHLRLLVPQRFYVHQQQASGDHHVYASLSRFLPNALVPLFESTVWPLPATSATEARVAAGPRIDLAERIRALWR